MAGQSDALGDSDQQGTSKDQVRPSSSSLLVYIVAPHTSQTIPLLHTILAKRMSDSAAAIDLLKKVQLLQFFDLAGLVESIGEVNESVYQLSQAMPGSHRAFASSSSTDQDLRTIVLIEGLAPTLTAAQRRSGIVWVHALLAGLIRSITQLSQLTARPLVLISVFVGVQLAGQPGNEIKSLERDGQGIPLESAFSGPNGEEYRLLCGSASLSRALEASLDRLIHVGDALGRVPARQRHQRFPGQYVVEVIKDRIGSTSGLWTTWKVPKP
ncbi:hypothetical protein LTR84_007318 [Exophiala bonariae]|uniref:Uncharacterized protein n=1 Tax=Exophiala bonariae TaxID=1690606 RepID=A0AAV9MZ21_9EURO|nr:hypothetical protein LTR84_007318 [Exophiala bonariae]